MTGHRRTIRCAIYTRKSSEEGLEQGFNSLEAQREACAAYIKSQAHEGWRLLPEHYDDGGHSGGTLERPAVQRLLEQVKARKLDIIVLYKIDRLTRSLADFARLAELFDQHGVSFVSVTQQFNTTTSMGRLMLNVLLSFAQFEREITGERIRDKVAASKKKGIWMGGWVPLGYRAKDRALIVDKEEAETVRTVFRLYLKHGNVRMVQTESVRLGLKTKLWRTSDGRPRGGRAFSRGHIYALLNNQLYVGRIRHKDQVHAGAHAPIIDTTTWDEVRRRLVENLQGERRPGRSGTKNLLAGLLFDAYGHPFTSSHTIKNGRRYRYYVLGASSGKVKQRLRIPADGIEEVVQREMASLLANRKKVAAALGTRVRAQEVDAALRAAAQLHKEIAAPRSSETSALFKHLLDRVTIDNTAVRVAIRLDRLRTKLRPDSVPTPRGHDYQDGAEQRVFEIAAADSVVVSGRRAKLIVDSGSDAPARSDPVLIKSLARAHRWFELLRNEAVASVREISVMERVTESYVNRVLRLAFLAPQIVEEAIERRSSRRLTTAALLLMSDLPLEWSRQYTCLNS